MPKLPTRQISDPERERFGDLFALADILSAALKSDGYRLSQACVESLRYRKYGLEVQKELTKRLPEADPNLLHVAMLSEFYWKDLFFDHEDMVLDKFISDISGSIRTKNLILPYIFGGLLYRKANSLFTEIKDTLEPTETASLLSETPQGVFQMRSFVTGPLGLLQSVQKRDYRPRRSVPLWHCADPSCTAIHTANLRYYPGPYDTIRTELRRLLHSVSAPMRHGDLGYHRLDEDSDYYDDLHTGDLIPLLGDAFSLTELRLLLKAILDRPGGLRARLNRINLGIKLGSSQQIADSLDAGGCLQLILLEEDQAIIETLEKLIEREIIRIPFSEVRAPRPYHPRAGWYGIRCEASRYGVRFSTETDGVPLARLKNVIRKIYEPSGNIGELAWKLRYVPGETAPQRLDHHVHQSDPEVVILEHVFGSAEAPEQAFKAMRYGHFPNTFTRDEEPYIVKKIIWKLGFDVPVFPLEYKRLSENLHNLRDISDSRSARGNEDILAIRSAAVNFFVELESFLGASLAFMYWVMTSDHYGATRFAYEKTSDQTEMARAFSDYQTRSGAAEPIKFSEEGKNTLYPLISGFRLLASLCRVLLRERSQYLRLADQTPGYVGGAGLHVFPFVHTKLFLDLRENINTTILSHLIEISDLLQSANVAGIRNRTGHARDEFPTATEISTMLDVVSSLVDRMQKKVLLL
jgi:hypothetical protein